MDNQLFFTKGLYDFPVLFYPDPEIQREKTPSLNNLIMMEKFAILKSSCFGYMHVVMETNSVNNHVVKSLELGTQSAIVNIDDSLVFRLMKEIEALIPTNINQSKTRTFSKFATLPLSFRSSSYSLSCPTQIESLHIQEIKLLLSIHASVKMYISADRTPLVFKKFDQCNISAMTQHVLMSLVMHYATAALFRAGIVVGSLEIIGNPTGLVRSVSTGVSDLVRLPANGMRGGPRAFMSGLSEGVSSFVKNTSAGKRLTIL